MLEEGKRGRNNVRKTKMCEAEKGRKRCRKEGEQMKEDKDGGN